MASLVLDELLPFDAELPTVDDEVAALVDLLLLADELALELLPPHAPSPSTPTATTNAQLRQR